MQDVVIASFMLKILWDGVSIVTLTPPCGIRHCSAVGTGAAIDTLGRLCLVAEAMGWTELALIPARVGADRLRHTI
jgi:hypothetical protein